VTWLIHMCDMTHSYLWHDSSICVTWLIHTCDTSRHTSTLVDTSVSSVSSVSRMSCHESCHTQITRIWRSYECVTSRDMSYIDHTNVAIIRMIAIFVWFMCDMIEMIANHVTHPCHRWITRIRQSYECVMSRDMSYIDHTNVAIIWLCHVTYRNESCHTY